MKREFHARFCERPQGQILRPTHQLLQRFEKIEVVGEPTRIRSSFVRGFSDFPVRIPA